MRLNPSAISRLYVRAPNWLGDAVMSLPAIRTVRQIFPHAYLAVVARPSLVDLYARESGIDRVIPYAVQLEERRGIGVALRARVEFARRLRVFRFDGAILLQNAFDAALVAWMAEIPERIGYRRDGRYEGRRYWRYRHRHYDGGSYAAPYYGHSSTDGERG